MQFTKGLRRNTDSRRTVVAAVGFCVEALERRVQLSVSLALSGTQTITPGSVVNASADGDNWESEMSVAVNPTNPLNIAGFSHNIGRVQVDPDANTIDVLYSTDGGATWSVNEIDGSDDGLGTGLLRGDPTITFDEDGRLYICYGFVFLTGTAPNQVGNIKLMVGVDATDGGASFEQFTEVDSVTGGLGIDKWIMTSGTDPLTDGPAVYVAYTHFQQNAVVVAGSNDGGETFTGPVSVSDSGHTGNFACPGVTPNGELYVSWRSGDNIWVDVDADGLFDATSGFGTDVSARSLANGGFQSYTVPRAQPDRGIHTAPVLAVDRSGGSYDARLYIAFVEKASTGLNEQDTNIKLAYSDNGTSWTTVTVDGTSGSTEFLPWVDVDQATGSVNVLYYTTDGDQSTGNEDVKMRMALSTNGGASWTTANATTITSDEYEGGDNTDDFFGDYLEYVGFDVEQGTAHGLFAFEPSGDQFDLEAMYVNAAFVNANNTLTIDGTTSGDTIVVQKHASNNDYLQVLVNSVTEFVGRLATVGKIVINGSDGAESVTINSAVTIPATINGGSGNDTITGGGGADSISGGDGIDSLTGGAANDTIYGGADGDGIWGGDGNDSLFGDAGNDGIYGDNGNDSMTGGSGSDYMSGGAGNDDFNAQDGEVDTLDGGSGSFDTAYVDNDFFNWVFDEDLNIETIFY